MFVLCETGVAGTLGLLQKKKILDIDFSSGRSTVDSSAFQRSSTAMQTVLDSESPSGDRSSLRVAMKKACDCATLVGTHGEEKSASTAKSETLTEHSGVRGKRRSLSTLRLRQQLLRQEKLQRGILPIKEEASEPLPQRKRQKTSKRWTR